MASRKPFFITDPALIPILDELQTLADNPPANAITLRWRASGHALRQLGPDTYLLTYSLRQQDRLTRRSTLWHRTPTGWQILYHQGTLVSANEDDIAPA